MKRRQALKLLPAVAVAPLAVANALTRKPEPKVRVPTLSKNGRFGYMEFDTKAEMEEWIESIYPEQVADAFRRLAK